MGYFLDDSGNFENFVKIWSRNPPNYYQNASKNTRKLWNHLGKILFLSIWDSQNFENVRNLYVLGTSFFDFSDFFLISFRWFSDFLCFFWVYILKIILRRWGIENYTFSITKQHPNLDMNFISIKKHEMEITLNFLILKDGTPNFYIFKKGTHPTLISR